MSAFDSVLFALTEPVEHGLRKGRWNSISDEEVASVNASLARRRSPKSNGVADRSP